MFDPTKYSNGWVLIPSIIPLLGVNSLWWCLWIYL